jgi:cyanophycinase-like exopeptidase
MRGSIYLVASGQDGVLPSIAKQAYDALGKTRALVGVSYAPVSGDPAGRRFMSERMPRLFPEAELATIDDDPGVVQRADLLFVSGGDTALGGHVLEASGVSARLRDAVEAGTPIMGVSAGAIVLGDWWVEWPEEVAETPAADVGPSGSCLIRCTGVVKRHVFDTHNEEDDWDELRIAAALVRQSGEDATFLGIPTGGALVFGEGGIMHAIGVPPFQLR